MKKELIIAIGISTLFGLSSAPVFAAGGDSGMDIASTFAMRLEKTKEMLELKGTLSCQNTGTAQCLMSLTDQKGQTFKIQNGDEALSLLKSGKTQVALEAIQNGDNEIKI